MENEVLGGVVNLAQISKVFSNRSFSDRWVTSGIGMIGAKAMEAIGQIQNYR